MDHNLKIHKKKSVGHGSSAAMPRAACRSNYSKVSSLLNPLQKLTTQLTFQNLYVPCLVQHAGTISQTSTHY